MVVCDKSYCAYVTKGELSNINTATDFNTLLQPLKELTIFDRGDTEVIALVDNSGELDSGELEVKTPEDSEVVETVRDVDAGPGQAHDDTSDICDKTRGNAAASPIEKGAVERDDAVRVDFEIKESNAWNDFVFY